MNPVYWVLRFCRTCNARDRVFRDGRCVVCNRGR